MGAVWLVFGAELRRRWRSWLILVVLIAVVGGLVLAASAAGRRTATAFPRFVAAHGYDFSVFNLTPVPGLAHEVDVASVTHGDDRVQRQPRLRLRPGHQRRQRQLHRPVAFGARPMSRNWWPAGCPTSPRPTRCWHRSTWNRTSGSTSGRWSARVLLHQRQQVQQFVAERERQPVGPDDDLPRRGDRDRRERVPRW